MHTYMLQSMHLHLPRSVPWVSAGTALSALGAVRVPPVATVPEMISSTPVLRTLTALRHRPTRQLHVSLV
jgi:hypothetical protein